MKQKGDKYGNIEPISPASDKREDAHAELLEAASAYSRRVLESIQAVAGTTAVKGVQIANLEKFAKEHQCWIEDLDVLGVFSDKGSENEVYLSPAEVSYVYKLNDFRYSDDNLSSFFERINAHNYYFPDCAYQLMGFARNQEGKICAVLKQRLINVLREATEEEIASELQKMGFSSELDGEYYTNNQHDIFDALPNNVLVGTDNHYYFIDTIIYKTEDGALTTYRSLSPRYSE